MSKASGSRAEPCQETPRRETPATLSADPATSTQRLPLESITSTKFTSCQVQLDAALSEIVRKDRIIDKLSDKVNQLTGATLNSRSVAREAKEVAKNVANDHQRAFTKISNYRLGQEGYLSSPNSCCPTKEDSIPS